MRFMKTNVNTQTQVNYNFQGEVISEEKIVSGEFVEQANFVRGDRVLVKKDKKKTKDYYYFYNDHGDVVQIVDTSGTIVNNYVYDEWGNITFQTEGIMNSFKYAGEMYDTELYKSAGIQDFWILDQSVFMKSSMLGRITRTNSYINL